MASLISSVVLIGSTTAGAAVAQPAISLAGQTITVATADTITPAIVKAFEKATGIKVIADNIGWDSLQTKVATAAEAHTYFADIEDVDWSETALYYKTGWFLPLNKYFNVSALQKQYPQLSVFIDHGELVALPQDSQASVTTVNAVDFKKAGITTMPTTLAQYTADLRTIKAKGVVKYPLVQNLGAQETLATTWWQLAVSYGGSVLTPSGQPDFTSPSSPGYKAAEWLLDAFKSGLISPAAIDYAEGELQTVMGHGDAATSYSDYTGVIGPAYNVPSQSKVVGQVQYLQSPGLTGPAKLIAEPDGMGIPAAAKHIAAAVEFMKWYGGAQVQAALGGASGTSSKSLYIPGEPLPPNLAGLKALAASPIGKVGDISLAAQLTQDSVPAIPGGGQPWEFSWSEQVAQDLHDTFTGEKSLPAAILLMASQAKSDAASS
jgi:multiple sugar transport system substrate-binding protein